MVDSSISLPCGCRYSRRRLQRIPSLTDPHNIHLHHFILSLSRQKLYWKDDGWWFLSSLIENYDPIAGATWTSLPLMSKHLYLVFYDVLRCPQEIVESGFISLWYPRCNSPRLENIYWTFFFHFRRISIFSCPFLQGFKMLMPRERSLSLSLQCPFFCSQSFLRGDNSKGAQN